MNTKILNRLMFVIAFILVFSDQLSKLLIKGFSFFGMHHAGLGMGDSISVIGDTVQFTFVENAGMAFGITFGAGKILLSLFSIAASLALIWYLAKIKDSSWKAQLSIALVLSGAAGNLIDRVFYGVLYGTSSLFYGNVVDFIQVDIPDISIFGRYYTHWPVFNFADAYVTVGVVLLLFWSKYLPAIKDVFHKNKNAEGGTE